MLTELRFKSCSLNSGTRKVNYLLEFCLTREAQPFVEMKHSPLEPGPRQWRLNGSWHYVPACGLAQPGCAQSRALGKAFYETAVLESSRRQGTAHPLVLSGQLQWSWPPPWPLRHPPELEGQSLFCCQITSSVWGPSTFYHCLHSFCSAL